MKLQTGIIILSEQFLWMSEPPFRLVCFLPLTAHRSQPLPAMSSCKKKTNSLNDIDKTFEPKQN